jgi:hypothetical protein
MEVALYQYRNGQLSADKKRSQFEASSAHLVLCFGAKHLLQDCAVFREIRELFPSAEIALCSTAGEIYHTEVFDDTISVTAIRFGSTIVKTHFVTIDDYSDSYEAGAGLFKKFDKDALSYLLVLSDGSKVNGSELVRGLNQSSSGHVLITGGLAGDGSKFQSTLTGLNSAPAEGIIIGIGFYGDKIKINHGCRGGWEMFGLEKTVTRSVNNVLYEIDGMNALELYKKYLGPDAKSLPGSALLFPLSVTLHETGEEVVRTILSINQDEGSMTFAGDLPVGSKVRLMKANFDKITHAASDAAHQALLPEGNAPKLGLLISCVGRKLILQSRTDEEVAAVDEIFDHKTLLSGFYSYGEISPLVSGGSCQLNNQTMTITTFDETE